MRDLIPVNYKGTLQKKQLLLTKDVKKPIEFSILFKIRENNIIKISKKWNKDTLKENIWKLSPKRICLRAL